MGRGVVDGPLKEVAEFYKDIQSTFLWDHLLVVSTCINFAFMIIFLVIMTLNSCSHLATKACIGKLSDVG